MEIKHDVENCRAWTEKDNYTAYVEYELENGTLNIVHTYVPGPLEGQGIASELVKYVYDYALHEGFTPAATCWYASTWLKRHIE